MLKSFEELDPIALTKFKADEKVRAAELEVKIKKRHDQNEFKTQQEIDNEKAKIEMNKPKQRTFKDKITDGMSKLGLWNK